MSINFQNLFFNFLFSIIIKNFLWVCVSCNPVYSKSKTPKFYRFTLNIDIWRMVSRTLKIRLHFRLQIKFFTTFILCKYTILLLLRVLNYKKETLAILLFSPFLLLKLFEFTQKMSFIPNFSDTELIFLSVLLATNS